MPVNWFGRIDSAETGDTRRIHQIVRMDPGGDLTGSSVLLGFCCDAGVSRNHGRPGAYAGPEAIRRTMANLALHRDQAFVDAGDVVCEGDDLEGAQRALSERIASVLARGGFPVILGGGHEIAWGSFVGLRQHLDAIDDTGSVLVVNLDAHLDLRASLQASSGTPFHQIVQECSARGRKLTYACLGVSRPNNTAALIAEARRIQAVLRYDDEMRESLMTEIMDDIQNLVADHDHVYLSIDLDVLPAAVAPGVSAPAAIGVSALIIDSLARSLRACGKLRLADIAEMNPAFDIDHRTARIAARLAWTLAAH